MEVCCPFVLNQEKFPENFTLVEYLFTEFPKYGKEIAMIDADTKKKWLYSELEDAVCELIQKVAKLPRLSREEGSRVLVVALNCPEVLLLEFALSFLGITNGRANAQATIDELVYLVTSSGATHVFWQNQFLQKSEQVDKKLKSELNSDGEMIPRNLSMDSMFEHQQGKGHSKSVQIQNLIQQKKSSKLPAARLMFFSSGTTGPQKTLELPLESLAENVHGARSTFFGPPQKGDRILCALPLHHVYGSWEAYCGLVEGCTLVIMPKYSPEKLMNLIEEYKITFMHVVPPILYKMVEYLEREKQDISFLRTVTTSGSQTNPHMMWKLQNLGVEDVRQAYGLTEACGVVTWGPDYSPKKR